MIGALDHKRTATRFRILVETADRQPAGSHGEIAAADGVEAAVSLRNAGIDPETTFAAGEVAAEAAARGVNVVVVVTADAVGRVTDALRDGGVLYEVTEAGAAVGADFQAEAVDEDGTGADDEE